MKRWCPRVLLFLYDAIAVNLAYYIALLLRFSDRESYYSEGTKYIGMFKEFLPWYTIACLVLFVLFGLYNIVWRYVGFNDIKKLALVNLLTCPVYIIGTLIVVGRMPVSCYILGAGIQFILMSVIRVAPRYAKEGFRPLKFVKGDETEIPLMILGVGDNTRIIQAKLGMESSGLVRPVCVVDYKYGYHGTTFNGLPVYSGDDAFSRAVDKHGIRSVIIADSSIPEDYLETVRSICEEKDIDIRDFIIGTGDKSPGVGLRDLLSKTICSVRIVGGANTEQAFDDGRSALRAFEDDRKVESVEAVSGEIVIRLRSTQPQNAEAGEEWIQQYREETGSDISFF